MTINEKINAILSAVGVYISDIEKLARDVDENRDVDSLEELMNALPSTHLINEINDVLDDMEAEAEDELDYDDYDMYMYLDDNGDGMAEICLADRTKAEAHGYKSDMIQRYIDSQSMRQHDVVICGTQYTYQQVSEWRYYIEENDCLPGEYAYTYSSEQCIIERTTPENVDCVDQTGSLEDMVDAYLVECTVENLILDGAVLEYDEVESHADMIKNGDTGTYYYCDTEDEDTLIVWDSLNKNVYYFADGWGTRYDIEEMYLNGVNHSRKYYNADYNCTLSYDEVEAMHSHH